MRKDRPNKIPRPATIAKHYAEGRYTDYPTDIILEAVNAHDHDYNPTAIPIRLGFRQLFLADFDAFVYLTEHRDEETIQAFLEDPNGYMAKAGIPLRVPLDTITPKVMAALLEDEMLEAMRDPEGGSVCKMVYHHGPHPWKDRHPERYDRGFMTREGFSPLVDIPLFFDEDYLESLGFNRHMGVDLYFIGQYFAEDR